MIGTVKSYIPSSTKKFLLNKHFPQRVEEFRKKLSIWNRYPKGVFFAGSDLEDIYFGEGFSITSEAETFKTSSKSCCLEEDGLANFYRPTETEFINHTIQVNHEDDFYFSGGYLFYKDYFFYERNFEKANLPVKYDFQNLLFFESNSKRWKLDNYFGKNNPLPTELSKHDVPVVSLSSNNNLNYFHWMQFPSLINISALEKNDPELLKKADFYVGPNFQSKLPPYVKQSLHKLNIAEDRLIYQPVKAPTLSTCLQETRGVTFSKSHLNFLRKNFMKTHSNHSWPKRVFIGRRDTLSRHIINEAEIFRFCNEKYGFEYISLSDLTLEQQTSLFHTAEVFVGAHGAGLTNVAFGKEGQWLVELLSPNHMNDHIYNIANHLGVNHAYILGDPLSNFSYSNYSISLEKVRRMLNLIL